MDVRENIDKVRERLEQACHMSGRAAEDVRLMAVTKYVDEERMGQAVDAGLTLLGENHAQEVREKLNFYKQRGAEVHFIGQLQSNKIKYLCGSVSCIESVDRLSLAESLEAFGQKKDTGWEVLLQVNIGREPQKGGVLPEDAEALLEKVCAMPHLQVRGLMCVPPAGTMEEAQRHFAAMYRLRERLQGAFPQVNLQELSMGMSHDFEAAVKEGATIVRVGSAIFGARNRL